MCFHLLHHFLISLRALKEMLLVLLQIANFGLPNVILIFFSVFDHVYVEKQNACTSPAATLLCVNCGFTVVSKVT